MGPQQVLRAAGVVAAFALGVGAFCAEARADDNGSGDTRKPTHERIAIVDLGPNAADPTTRQALAAAATSAGLDPATGDDGIDQALAGQTADLDQPQLTDAIDRATKAFAALDCKTAVPAATQAIGLMAARQADGYPVPELPRAYAYQLLCADRSNDSDAAMRAASRLRVVGAPPDVAPLLTKYPEVDSSADREVFEVEVKADIPDAVIWVDHKQIGKSPVMVALGPGEHLLAAAGGTRRGWAAGTAIKTQRSVTIETHDVAVKWTKLSRRIANWHGTVPPVYELAAVMTEAHARILVIRHGDVLEAWGRIGQKEEPHRLGSEEGVLGLADTAKVMALVADRAHAWNDHAPDPDQPLLLETAEERAAHNRRGPTDTPTKWWVYATIFGAIAAGALLVYLHDQSNDTQNVELHFPVIAVIAWLRALAMVAVIALGAAPAHAVTLEQLPQRGRVAVDYEPGLDKLAGEVDAAAEAALAEIYEDLVDAPPPRAIHVQLVRDASSLAAIAPAGRGAPAYAIGVAYPDLGVISVATRRGSELVDPISTLRHELGHLALAAAVGDHAPRWLHEGFAAQHAHEWTWQRTELLSGMAWFGGVMSYDELDREFPSEEAPASRAYAESEDFVGFLSRRGRWEDSADDGDRWPFRHFLANLGKGMTIDDAAHQAYGKPIRGLFEEWRDDLGKRYLWAPVGVLSLGVWVLCGILLALAWWRRRRGNRRRLAQWDHEDRVADAQRVVVAPPYVPWPGEDPFGSEDDDDKPPPRIVN